ncbi:putative DNA polymerase family B [Candidatus Promineifilum breve]|uniref:DNA-directed DNA polymerase n=1 Tax=Candidatus Promineifilum breve TaxID=1806508 RepID=A0A160T5P9_9CHLR|nr:DNA polymerase domain-containing protein [Candidatus Promineifilum breve]CUS05606.1 putative DNA polymerase family B [Candidatus Promineifilum breve]
MTEHDGWLLDLYPDADGLTLWLLGDDGARRRLHHAFPVTFYAAGPFPRLRALWLWLRDRPDAPRLRRERRRDLFAGELDVLAMVTPGPAAQARLLDRLLGRFPDLDYYDADVPAPLRYAAVHGVFPLARCRVLADAAGRVSAITPLDEPWTPDPDPPPLRVLSMAPDVDPALRSPTCLIVANGRGRLELPVDPPEALMAAVHATLRRHDPDLLLTRYGDTWLFPLLLDTQRRSGAAYFNPNRDPDRRPLCRRARSYFTYGQVVHRGRQVHLFGRWHIDAANAMMYGEYGLPGVLEQARVTALPVQEIARKSPGAGITAMQMLTALRWGVLVPHQKQQTERFKTAAELIQADRGGLVYQPLIGLHDNVAEIDFTSMYPSIMVRFNISPETVGITNYELGIRNYELGMTSDGEPSPSLSRGERDALPCPPAPLPPCAPGLVPATLRPLLARRIALKEELAAMDPRDCRYRALKARAAALKWLLVVCFGYLGYKNARFGRIEGHEAVTAYGREMLLRAKEAAEDMGYTVLHMYVDGLWIRHPTDTAGGLAAVMAEITRRTDLPIALEGIYRWVAFLPSRMDERVPVANRYFGVFRDGSFKVRGIEARRHDTPPFIAAAQLRLLETLAAADGPPADQLPAAVALLRDWLADLRAGRVAPAELLVSHRLSRALGDYRGRPPGARAAAQLVAAGKPQPPGRRVRFLYTLGEPGVYAWGSPAPLEPATIDAGRYADLLLRAAANLLQPFIGEAALRRWVAGEAQQLPLSYKL